MDKPPLVITDREVMGGTPVFYGTRVPIQHLVDYLTTGDSIDDFLCDFPTVSREQVIEVIQRSALLIMAEGRAYSD